MPIGVDLNHKRTRFAIEEQSVEGLRRHIN